MDEINNTNKKQKIIKKYSNRKLYDTHRSTYVVLDDIKEMIRNKEDIKVIENDTQNDITVSTLTQIISTAEKESGTAAPAEILKRIITEGDGSFSSFLSQLGLFKAEESVKKENHPNRSSENPNPNDLKLDKNGFSQTVEQKIANIASSSEEGAENIPHLPGSTL